MYGKAAEDLNKLDQKGDSITEAMKEKGFSVQEVSDYIYALHAKERNALIRERSEGEEKEGSGMSDHRKPLTLLRLSLRTTFLCLV